jgi:N-acetyl-gamma-glutamyl-phosphate reductase/acetylglutamate kinase
MSVNMFRRAPALARALPPRACTSARALSTSTTTAAPALAAASSNVAFELDVKKVGAEIRSRGLSTAVQTGGMDRDTIIRLLYSLGNKHEVERYLRIFTQSSKVDAGGVLPEAKFAVLKWVPLLRSVYVYGACIGRRHVGRRQAERVRHKLHCA